ncbi:MAG: HlyD family efflux transporter periplasmic adaptor subunit [Tissierellia bacterium]|nr:HlyD family efflux transporter periplasmic adaptor subunit [Tissierellia bacterium]
MLHTAQGRGILIFDEILYDFQGVGIFNPRELQGRIAAATTVGELRRFPGLKPPLMSKEGISFFDKLPGDKGAPLGQSIEGFLGSVLPSQQPTILEQFDEDGIVKSPRAGVVYFTRDGYEDRFPFHKELGIAPEEFNEVYSEEQPVEMAINGFRIVDNNFWRGIFHLDHPLESLRVGETIALQIHSQPLKGKVLFAEISESGTMVELEFGEGYDLVEELRFIQTEMILDTNWSYTIPKTAVMLEGDEAYVYRLNFSGFVEKVPVQILSERDAELLITTGSDGFIQVRDQMVATVRSFDEIILHPKAVQEGDLVR